MITTFDKAMFRTLLAFKGLSIKEVAAATGIDYTRLSAVLAGREAHPAACRQFVKARLYLADAPWPKRIEDEIYGAAVVEAVRAHAAWQRNLDWLKLNTPATAGSSKAVAA